MQENWKIVGVFISERIPGKDCTHPSLHRYLTDNRLQEHPQMALLSNGDWKAAGQCSIDWRGEPAECSMQDATSLPLRLGLEIRQTESRITCLRGPLGHIPFFYRIAEGILYFSTHLRQLLDLTQEHGVSVRSTQVAEYLQFQRFEGRSTFYNEIHRLEPGGKLVYSANGSSLGWLPPKVESLSGVAPEMLADALLEETSRLPDSTGFLLSGGIDSCSLAGVARTGSGRGIGAIHYLVKDNASDTLHARSTATRLGIPLIELDVCALDPLARLGEEFYQLGEPHNVPNSYMTRSAGLAAQSQGMETLVLGEGGDSVFSLGFDLPSAYLKRGRALASWRSIRGLQNLFGGGTLQYLKQDAIKPLLPPRLLRVITRRTPPKPWIRPECMNAGQWHDQLWQGHVERHSRFGSDYHLADLFHPLNLQTSELDQMGETMDAVEYCNPLYSPSIVEIGLNIPLDLKLKNGFDRYLLRKAAEPYLPQETAWRKGKGNLGAGITIGMHRHSDLAGRWEEVRSHTDPYVDPATFGEILQKYMHSPDVKSAQQIWPVIALGLWLRDFNSRQNKLAG